MFRTAARSLLAATMTLPAVAADPSVKLITLDPAHFHAALVQKLMYPQVSPVVRVYAPEGPDLKAHLQRIEAFNTRAENPTHWEEKVYTGADFLERMLAEKPGNVVVISGSNLRKTEYIDRSISAGLNVLGDKPMALTPADFERLRGAFQRAASAKVLLYDIMTERFEITSILQRELAQVKDVFGALQTGTPQNPAVVMESVHHFFKEVDGKPLTRPAWFFDVRQQGEALSDVSTHLVDLVQWECFPGLALDWQKDVKVNSARRWPTELTLAQFQRATGLGAYPDFLRADVGKDNILRVFQNGEVHYTLRGINIKVTALWNFEAPPGAKDTHYSVLRGTRASLVIKQGAAQGYSPVLYVENTSHADAAALEQALRSALAKFTATWPGLDLKRSGDNWEVVVPAKYAVGHEAHFAQVTESYLRYLAAGKMPAWEVPNMLAKYYTTTEAFRLSH